MAQKPLNTEKAGDARIVPIKMPDDLIELVRAAAARRGVSVSEYARVVLERQARRDMAKP